MRATRPVMATLIGSAFAEGGQAFDGGRGFGQPGRDEHRPDMHSVPPGLESSVALRRRLAKEASSRLTKLYDLSTTLFLGWRQATTCHTLP
jgi:hypothetical protein